MFWVCFGSSFTPIRPAVERWSASFCDKIDECSTYSSDSSVNPGFFFPVRDVELGSTSMGQVHRAGLAQLYPGGLFRITRGSIMTRA